jgi:hypothetical protein
LAPHPRAKDRPAETNFLHTPRFTAALCRDNSTSVTHRCGNLCSLHGARGTVRVLALISDAANVCAILAHLGQPTALPRIAVARGPPLWDTPDAGMGTVDRHSQRAPECAFEQRIAC